MKNVIFFYLTILLNFELYLKFLSVTFDQSMIKAALNKFLYLKTHFKVLKLSQF